MVYNRLWPILGPLVFDGTMLFTVRQHNGGSFTLPTQRQGDVTATVTPTNTVSENSPVIQQVFGILLRSVHVSIC